MASLKVPVAVNCCDPPKGMDGFCGVILTEERVAVVTVRFAEPATPPKVALTVPVPDATAVASPCPPAVLLAVATAPAPLQDAAR